MSLGACVEQAVRRQADRLKPSVVAMGTWVTLAEVVGDDGERRVIVVYGPDATKEAVAELVLEAAQKVRP